MVLARNGVAWRLSHPEHPFFMDQTHTVIFEHRTPAPIAFFVMMAVLSCQAVFRLSKLNSLMQRLTVKTQKIAEEDSKLERLVSMVGFWNCMLEMLLLKDRWQSGSTDQELLCVYMHVALQLRETYHNGMRAAWAWALVYTHLLNCSFHLQIFKRPCSYPDLTTIPNYSLEQFAHRWSYNLPDQRTAWAWVPNWVESMQLIAISPIWLGTQSSQYAGGHMHICIVLKQGSVQSCEASTITCPLYCGRAHGQWPVVVYNDCWLRSHRSKQTMSWVS